MKALEMFYQKNCPYCKKAFNYINELQEENDVYRLISIKLTDEELEVDYADEFDYFHVPAFYINGRKAHEGAITKTELKEIFEEVLQ